MASNNNLMVRLLLNTQGFDTNIQKSSQQIKQFQVRINEVGKNVSAFGDGLGINIGQLAKFGTAAGVAAAAGKVLSDAFMKNESNADAFNSALEQSKAAYSSFLNTINGGSWSNFFSNMEKAIKDARELYDLMDKAGSTKANNAVTIATYDKLIAEARLKLADKSLSKEEREKIQRNIQTYSDQKRYYQAQGVNAQLDAANRGMYNVIADRIRSIGVRVADSDINKYIGRAKKEGQNFFDEIAKEYKSLRQKGMVETVRTITNQYGGSSTYKTSYFDISKLSKQEQLKYALGAAFTEGEGDFQKFSSMYAEALNESTTALKAGVKELTIASRDVKGTPKPDETKPKEPLYKNFTDKEIKEIFKKDFISGGDYDGIMEKVIADAIEKNKDKDEKELRKEIEDAFTKAFDNPKLLNAYIDLFKKLDVDFIKRNHGIISNEDYQRTRYNGYLDFSQKAANEGNIAVANAAVMYAGYISSEIKDIQEVSKELDSLTHDIRQFRNGLASTDVDALKENRTALKEVIGNYNKNSNVMTHTNLLLMLETLEAIVKQYDAVIQKQEAWNMKMNNFKNISTTLDVSANAVNSIGSAFKSAAIAAQQAGDVMKAKSLETTGFLFQATAQIAEMISEVYKLCIVNGVASAAKLPYPANLVAIATMIGTISSMVAMGFSTFSNQKYASGGIVQGNGSGWSDSVPTLLSNGEMVLNRRQQGNLFALLDGNRISDSLSNGKVEFRISGANLVGTLNNYNKKTSKVL